MSSVYLPVRFLGYNKFMANRGRTVVVSTLPNSEKQSKAVEGFLLIVSRESHKNSWTNGVQ